jgi:alpha-ketoglutarate-dependent taurine dioxygenase
MQFLAELATAGDMNASVMVRDALAESKVVVLRHTATPEDDAFYRALGDDLGRFHFLDEDAVTGELSRSGWLDVRYDADLAARSAYRYGNGRMPLHVDGAYSDVDFDVFFLRCQTAARFGGATFVVDGEVIVDYLSMHDPALLRSLLGTEVQFVKGERSATRAVLAYDGDDLVFNWSSTRIAPDNAASVLEMCARFDRFCEDRLVDGGLVTPIRLAPGDAVFVHNRKVLHGRYAFWGERCLLKGVVDLDPIVATRQ